MLYEVITNLKFISSLFLLIRDYAFKDIVQCSVCFPTQKFINTAGIRNPSFHILKARGICLFIRHLYDGRTTSYNFV